MALGEFGNFLSYGFAPASVIAPLGTVALIANCVFAPVVLGESFTRRNVLGVVLAIIGAVTVVWSSRDDNKRVSLSFWRRGTPVKIVRSWSGLLGKDR
jgi:drug/metabolite transporter (DMT)-like permease